MDKDLLNIAAVQMDANLAPTNDRLARAERLVTAAAESGADLVVLPELFNTGYSYGEENHARVETFDGLTVTWLRHTAIRLDVHLAGSLMLLEQGEVYNALLLFAPDGRMWRYDKNYPAGWERGSYRESRLNPRFTVAETDLGNIGMLICWDTAHLNLWEMYAGRIDLMLISSCPADVSNGTYLFPNGDQITFDDMGERVASAKNTPVQVFGDMVNQQTAWLGVPAVMATACGKIQSSIPQGRQMFLGFSFLTPWLLKYIPQADRLKLSFGILPECKVVDGTGDVLAKLTAEDGEAFALAEVTLADPRPSPHSAQPDSSIPWLSYFSFDFFLPMITKSMYRRGRRQWRKV